VTWRTAGFAATVLAVLILFGSMVQGMRERPGTVSSTGLLSPTGRTARPNGIRVEVFNGTGIPGLAREVTERLRGDGFDVVTYGNAAGRDSTTLIDRAGNHAAMEALSEALRVSRIETALDTTLYLDATLVLGADWKSGLAAGSSQAR
jgi:hypothetical protein